MVSLEPLKDIGINKHIAAIHCTPLATKGHEDCLNASIAIMQAYAKEQNIDILDIPNDGIQVKKEDFHAMLPEGLRRNLDRVSPILMDLSKMAIEWNLWGQDKTRSWSITPFFKEVKEGGSHYIFFWNDRLFFNAFVRPKIYAPLRHKELSHRMQMTSRFGARLYEFGLGALATMNKNEYTTEYIPVDLVRVNIFDSNPNKNKAWSNFRDRVLTPAINSVNNETDMTVSIDFARYRNKVSSICFKFKRKADALQINLFNSDEPPLSNDQAVLVDKLREEGVNPPSMALTLVKEYESGYISFVLRELEIQRKSVKRPGAWLNRMVTKDILRKEYNISMLSQANSSNLAALESQIQYVESKIDSISNMYNGWRESTMERFYTEVDPIIVAEYENAFYKSIGEMDHHLIKGAKGKSKAGYKNKTFYEFLCNMGDKDKNMGPKIGICFISLEIYSEQHLGTGIQSLKERLENLKSIKTSQKKAS